VTRRTARAPAPPTLLRIDPAACDGIGVCAHLAPNTVSLDRWGFPVIADGDLDRTEAKAAARAVRACPRAALWIEQARS